MISRVLRAAMVGVHAVGAIVAMASNGPEEEDSGVDRKFPNKATMISGLLELMTKWVLVVGAIAAISGANPNGMGARNERNRPNEAISAEETR